MSALSLIVAMDLCGGLGKDNQLLCHLPADLKHFKALTLGKPVVMGRKTHESIGKVLPGRLNVVLSRQPDLMITGVTIARSLTEAIALLQAYPEVMIIGGAHLFLEALPRVTTIYLTKIHARLDADVFFPSWDSTLWQCVSTSECPRDEHNPYAMTFYHYTRSYYWHDP